MNRFTFVIPYRNRPNSLAAFCAHFPQFLLLHPCIEQFNILIVEQEAGKPFNLAKIINTGFAIAKEKFNLQPEDRFIFHPVDCLPLKGEFEIPRNAAVVYCDDSEEIKKRDSGIWGKAHGFRVDTLEKINGYSNEYWGWGCEDNDLFIRLDILQIPVVTQMFSYHLLMGHGDDHAPDVDRSDVETQNYLKNRQVLEYMIEARNPLISGLNTLEYRVLGEEVLDAANHIYQVRVSI